MILAWPHRLYYWIAHKRDIWSVIERVDPMTAAMMPDLGLPQMGRTARTAFRAVLNYEKPPGNSSVEDILLLAQARGYSANPCDWVPLSYGDGQFPALYRPWAEWLARKGYTRLYDGVPMTSKNWKKWSREGRQQAFRSLLQKDRAAAHELLLNLVVDQPASTRLDLLQSFNAGGMFSGNYPSDVPVLYRFLEDPSEEVRALARKKLNEMGGLKTEIAHATKLAPFFTVPLEGEIAVSAELFAPSLMRHTRSTSLDALADVLDISATDFIRRLPLEAFKSDFYAMIGRTATGEPRKILATRKADAGEEAWAGLFQDVDAAVWRKGLEAAFSQPYPSTVFDFLGDKVGTLETIDVRKISHYRRFAVSVTDELDTGTLPVNTRHDPLRSLALVANKQAADDLLNEALALGMDETNPRLTMLRLNLAL